MDGAGNDTLYSEDGDDLLIQSGSGTQTFDGGAGNDTFKLDTGFLEPGFDSVISADLSTGFFGLKDDPQHVLNDTLINIENVDLSSASFDVAITGDDSDNLLVGGAGDDT